LDGAVEATLSAAFGRPGRLLLSWDPGSGGPDVPVSWEGRGPRCSDECSSQERHWVRP
jgi:hypothetical protein